MVCAKLLDTIFCFFWYDFKWSTDVSHTFMLDWLQCFINLPKGKSNSSINNISFQIIIYHSLSSSSSSSRWRKTRRIREQTGLCEIVFARTENKICFEYKPNDLKFYFIEFWIIVFTYHLIELFALIWLMPANVAIEDGLDHTNVNWFRAYTKSVNH